MVNWKADKINKFTFATLFFLFFILGILCTIGYQTWQMKSTLAGLRFEGNYTEREAENFANDLDNGYGDWICVNVKGMSYERGLAVCKHEMGHEVFAEFCEINNNIEKCINITKNQTE